MKTKFRFIILLMAANLLEICNCKAQATVLGNSSLGGDYIGWDASVIVPLQIRHDNVQPIDFYTSGLQRATITGPEGFFGLSDDWFPLGSFIPDAQIHQNALDGVDLWHHFTTGRTGLGFNAGFKLGLYDNGAAGWAEAHFEQWHYAPIITMLADASANYKERIKVWQGLGGDQAGGWANTPDITKISISHGLGTSGSSSYSPLEVSMLNMGRRGGSGLLAGNRSWMDVGTFYNFDSDNMYVGLKDDGINKKDAVINWGDDPYPLPDQDYENLLFIFTSAGQTATVDPYNYTGVNGLTVARMNAKGQMGIGAGFSSTLTPKRRLDIFDDGVDHNGTAYPGGPQLRLSAALNTNTALGTWTDFQTTTAGNLYIHPSIANTPGFVGINTSSPTNTLEINSNATSASPGESGLTFTDLTTSSTVGTNLFPARKGVLSVDGSGKVILVEDETVSPSSGVNVCGAGVANNYVLRMDVSTTNTICQSEIFDDYSARRVGIDDNTPSYKLDVAGDLGINGPLFYNGNRMLSTDGAGVPSFGSNLYLGTNAGNISTPNLQYGNTAIGVSALASLDANAAFNTAVGWGSFTNNVGSSTTGGANTGLGSYSGLRNTTGNNNVFLGYQAGIDNQTGNDNIAIGSNSGSDGASGSGDIGDENILIGTWAGSKSTVNTNGNIDIGYGAGYHHQNGNDNIYIGRNATEDPFQATNQFENILLIGENSYAQYVSPATSLTNASAIGAFSTVRCDNCIVLGREDNTRTLMGYTNVPTVTPNDCRLFVNNIGTSPNAAFFNGTIYAGAWSSPSDPSLKTAIEPMNSIDQILSQLHPQTYYFDSTGRNARLNLPRGLQYGLLSTDIERVLPNYVSEQSVPATYDSLGNVLEPSFTFKSVNYVGLIPILLKKIQDQQAELDSINSNNNLIQDRLDQLESKMNACCNNSSQRTSGQGINVELSSENTIILNQNDPNPFAEQTRITFTIPSSVNEAKMIFFDNNGHVFQTVTISERGQSQINVYGEKLSSGIYSYSLIADGKVIDTKKMVCTK